MFQKVCDKCGKVIQNKDKHMELNTEAWQNGGTIWKDEMWLIDIHLCEKCSQELVEWLGRDK